MTMAIGWIVDRVFELSPARVQSMAVREREILQSSIKRRLPARNATFRCYGSGSYDEPFEQIFKSFILTLQCFLLEDSNDAAFGRIVGGILMHHFGR